MATRRLKSNTSVPTPPDNDQTVPNQPDNQTTVPTPPDNNQTVPVPPEDNTVVPTPPENGTSTPEPPVTPAPAEKARVPEPTGKTGSPIQPAKVEEGQAVPEVMAQQGTSASGSMVKTVRGHGTKQSSQAAPQLPQTNERSANWLSLLGLSLLSFLGLGKIRRRKNN